MDVIWLKKQIMFLTRINAQSLIASHLHLKCCHLWSFQVSRYQRCPNANHKRDELQDSACCLNKFKFQGNPLKLAEKMKNIPCSFYWKKTVNPSLRYKFCCNNFQVTWDCVTQKITNNFRAFRYVARCWTKRFIELRFRAISKTIAHFTDCQTFFVTKYFPLFAFLTSNVRGSVTNPVAQLSWAQRQREQGWAKTFIW